VAQLRAHKPDLLVLALVCDERTLDRLLDLRGRSRMPREERTPGGCSICGEPLPRRLVCGRCGWCVLAGRLYAGAPLTREVLATFEVALVGPDSHAQAGTPRALDLDGAD
jgi:hypothetical protein